MRQLFKALIYSIIALLYACGSKDSFVVEGTLAGGETQSLRFIYYADGALRTIPGAAREGKFRIEGKSAEPAVIDILSNDGRIVGRVYAKNGDEIECQLNRLAPWEITLSGTDENERWAAFIRANADAYKKADSKAISKAVTEYVKANPDDVVSTLLLATSYDCHADPTSATKLLETISPEARPMSIAGPLVTMLAGVTSRPDSIDGFRYYARVDTLVPFDRRKAEFSLLAFSDSPEGKERADSIVEMLRDIRKKFTARRLQVLDLSMNTDSFSWRRSIRPDSASWTQVWLPGSAATAGLENAAIGSLPWFVVADSSGAILYRGASVRETRAAIDNLP